MHELRRVLFRLLNLVRPQRGDAGLSREVASHLALLEDEFRRRGLSAAEAHRQARLTLGGIDQTIEQQRDARTFRWLDDARRDVVYGVRVLRRRPLAAATAILSLAIGIGLNVAVFSVVDWVLLRPLPYPQAHQLVQVRTAGTTPVTGPTPVTLSEFTNFSAARAFRSTTAYSTGIRVLGGLESEPRHVTVARVAGELFGTLAVWPQLGRAFNRDELSTGSPVVLLAHETWQRQFSGNVRIVGQIVRIDGVPHTVIGVMPATLGHPRDADVWRPLTASEREDDDRELTMIARLGDQSSPAGANAELATLAAAMSKNTRTAWGEGLQHTDTRRVRLALQALLAAALLTLLIACANLAALVSSRGLDRISEIALRSALGASRRRLVVQLLTETLILVLIGGALGLLLGRWALPVLLALAPGELPRLPEIALDHRILVAGLVATLVTGLLVGIVPAVRLARGAARAGLACGGGLQAAPRTAGRRAMVITQVAMAVILTTGAGLLSRSFQHLITVDHGFAAERLIAVDLYLRGGFEGDARPLFHELITAAEAVPGVRSAAVSMHAPTQVSGLRTRIQLAGDSTPDSPAILRPISHTYFDTVEIALVTGRAFAATDTQNTSRVAIVNEAFVRELLGGARAVGLRILPVILEQPMTIVGVVDDVTPADEPERPALYVPIDQTPIGSGELVVRSEGDPQTIIPVLAARLRTVAPSLAFDRIRPVTQVLAESRAVTRFSMQLANAFAVLSLLLAMIGIYGLTSGDVTTRWRELAVRLALGATRKNALWTVLRPCVTVLGGGAALGLVGAMSVSPLLASLLHGVAPRDTLTLIAAPLVLALVGVSAAFLAGVRILRADPAATLRNE